MLPLLSDELLLDAYRHAVRMQLDREFVQMLMAEIRRRRLHPPEESASAAVASPVA
ncbi:MAG TPA: sporulation histidine kinase inhibitor Sda [Paenibacillaceae bacterium]